MDILDDKSVMPDGWMRRLGQYEWIEVKSNGNEWFIKARWNEIQNLTIEEKNDLGKYLKKSPENIVAIYAHSKRISQGRKVFKPTLEQCLAMEQVDLDFPAIDYTQPFNTWEITLPNDYIDTIYHRFENKLPYSRIPYRIIMCEAPNKLFIILEITHDNVDFNHSMLLDQEIMENKCARVGTVNPTYIEETNACIYIKRVCLNFGLLLSNNPITLTPTDPHLYKKLIENLHHRKKEKRTRAHLELMKMPNVINFQQSVQVYDIECHPGEKGKSGIEIRPHWRRGYWRNQHHGVKNSQIKKVFIKPVLVKLNLFKGNVANTMTEYVSKRKMPNIKKIGHD